MTLPPSFAERLERSLESLRERYEGLVRRSEIRNVDLNRGGGPAVFIGFAEWDWRADDSLVADRTELLTDFDEWVALFQLLHRTPVPEVSRRTEGSVGLLRRWLTREGGDHSVPSDVEQAIEMVNEAFDALSSLVAMSARRSQGLLAVPDTNALLRCPDVAKYQRVLPTDDFVVILIPTVLSELDELKDRGRTPEVRKAAAASVRRIKGLRDRGRLRSGVPVEGKITLRAEHREVRTREILDWLDPDVADDRILASALDLQSRHPSSTLFLVTADINLQNKADAVGLPVVDPPS